MSIQKLSRPQYWITNESIEATVNALDIKKDDSIISVCGSFDLPASFSEFTHEEIVTFDKNLAQLELGKYRQEILKRKRFNKFYEKSPFYQTHTQVRLTRDNYFKQANRLSNISKKVGQVRLIHSSVEGLELRDKFSIAYLSNIPITPNLVKSVNAHLVQDGKISFCILNVDKKDFQIPDSWELDIKRTQKSYKENLKKSIWYHMVCRYKS